MNLQFKNIQNIVTYILYLYTIIVLIYLYVYIILNSVYIVKIIGFIRLVLLTYEIFY